jgi:hypothetical protein
VLNDEAVVADKPCLFSGWFGLIVDDSAFTIVNTTAIPTIAITIASEIKINLVFI